MERQGKYNAPGCAYEVPGAEKRASPSRALLMSIRQALIIAIGAIEEYLGLERTITPKRKRNARG